MSRPPLPRHTRGPLQSEMLVPGLTVKVTSYSLSSIGKLKDNVVSSLRTEVTPVLLLKLESWG